MLKKSKSISVTGSSVITIDGVENTIASMSANIDENGTISRNSFINNSKVYRENMEEIDADIDEFNAYVKALVEEQE